jgi:succinate dehydrogenase / fumarate reductase membrane anchor subunit
MDLQNPIRKARGLGSAKHGVNHWIAQRATAVALIGLVAWFMFFVVNTAKNGGGLQLLSSPWHSIMLVIFVAVSFYHAALGLRVVIEDYVHCKCARPLLIFSVNALSIFLVVAVTFATFYTHVLTRAHQVPAEKMMLQKPCHKDKTPRNCHKTEGQLNSAGSAASGEAVEKSAVPCAEKNHQCCKKKAAGEPCCCKKDDVRKKCHKDSEAQKPESVKQTSESAESPAPREEKLPAELPKDTKAGE